MKDKEEKIDSKENLDEKESELEEELEEIEADIDDEKFKDFFISTNSKSPSLEQVAIAPRTQVDLETELANIPIEKKEDEQINYNAINYSGKKEKTYQENINFHEENLIVDNSISIARENQRDFVFENRQNFRFNPELTGMKKSQDDYIVKSPSQDFKEFKTQDPFQKIKKEYEFR
jgi:hypothetical protein